MHKKKGRPAIQTYVSGNATFRRFTPRATLGKLLTKRARRMFAQSSWDLKCRLYHGLSGEELFAVMDVAQCIQLILKNNYHQNIIREICTTRFPLLIRLDLQANDISSVELIASLECPSLQELNLEHNRIYSLKGFRKITTAIIKTINLFNNFTSDVYALSQMDCPMLCRLLIDSQKNKAANEDISWVSKLKSSPQYFYQLDILNGKRLSVGTTENMLFCKYRALQIRRTKRTFFL